MFEEHEKLTNDKQFFDEQRATLENERKQLTDAAIKLGHEVGVGKKYQISNEFICNKRYFVLTHCDLFLSVRFSRGWIADFGR